MKTKLLLLHGALGSISQLDNLKDLLASNFEIYTFNFEGHGKDASLNKPFSIDLFTDNVIQFLTTNNIETISIFGYSMGGYVALNVTHKFPKKINSIVTLATKFNWTETTASQEAKLLNPDKIEEKVPAFANTLNKVHGSNWKQVVSKTASMMLDLGNDKTLTDTILQSIKHKTLITIGDKDKMVSIEESQNSASLLPNGTLKIIEGFPHAIEKTDQKQLASIITSFLNS